MAKIIDTIEIEFDKAKMARMISQLAFGQPGHGRKTKFIDLKKRASKLKCRGKVRDDG